MASPRAVAADGNGWGVSKESNERVEPMTYTFKLSRRLAVSRYAMLAAAAMLVGCDGETTAPESDPKPVPTLDRVHLVPSQVTVEVNQAVQFRGVRQSARGERHVLPLTWHASGGEIDDAGVFMATTAGTYKVIGKGRGRQKPDTSIVVVVPPQPNIVAVSVSPDTTTVGAGGSHGFAAVGVLSDGTTVAIGVNWRATGGSVDASGVYSAGTTTGKYRVIATNTDGTLEDTAAVTITEAPPPPAAPTLEQLILSPGTLALRTGATAQLAAYGRNSLGDSIPVAVTYSATGGSITTGGLYTAGATGGSFRVIASAGVLADTAPVSLTAPPPPPPSTTERPFAVGFWEYPTTLCNSAGVTGSARTRSTSNLLEHLQTARKCGMRVVLAPNRSSITTTGTTKSPFSLDSAKAYIDRLALVLVPDTLAKYDAQIVGLNLADDYGSTDQWGGTTVSQSQIQAWAQYTKQKIPGLRLGVRVEATWVTPALASTIDYAWAQYHKGKGDPTTYFNRQRDVAASLGISLATGVNSTHCGGSVNPAPCTPDEIRSFMGMAVQRPESCGAFAWDYDTRQMAVSGMPEAWAYVVGLAKQRGGKPCVHL